MILSKYINSQGQSKFLLHIGLGLVGSALEAACSSSPLEKDELKSYRVDWSDVKDMETKLEDVFKFITESESTTGSQEVHIIWAAGKVGFNASDDECSYEMNFFRESLTVLSGLASSSRLKIIIHFISSAGGLFEGQRFISEASLPAPKRPYGRFKLAQECFLNDNKESFHNIMIYRPSSIYSAHNVSGRKGLLAVLIEYGIKNREITLTGSDDTQRDYVLDADIGTFVVEQIFNNAEMKNETHFLIQGKSSTILEIRLLLERIMNRKLILRFSTTKENSADMSFTSGLKPSRFETSPLPTNLTKLYLNLLSR